MVENLVEKVETPDLASYKKIRTLIEQWLDQHRGETFDLDTIYRQLDIRERINRNYVSTILSKLVSNNILDKNNRLYRYIDKTIKVVRWWDADAEATADISFPHGREEDTNEGINTYFGFDGKVVISKGQTIIIAGKSNSGKTAFVLNMLWENMDKIPCTLMGNEYTPSNFKRRTNWMKWASPLREDGTPKFELIERHDNWKDIIRPDGLNLIDWINLGDNFYQVGTIIEGIQSKLHDGVAVICLQVAPGKELGLGGGFSMHLASLYLSIDYERLKVLKAKEWNGHNPNNEMYGFQIINHGTQFHNIHKIKPCGKCYASGKSRGAECDVCNGKGYIDIKEELG